ncbi:UNVERIFIED_CONTAM: hypothetical protein GTU68_054936 [Idotea baltica]|nr:hypothetical protein [Idotea baltica]
MIEQCTKNIALDSASIPVNIHQTDICNFNLDNAAISVLNFTLQFIAIDQRMALLQNIAQATKKNGVLLLSEKIKFNDHTENNEISDLHHQFKRLNGYSDLEISQKRQALEDVLIPESIETHKERLLDAGFSRVFNCVQCFNFISFLAIK